MKKWAIGVFILGMVAAAAIYWLHGNLDGLVARGIEKYGSLMTQTQVRVSSVEIRSADGQGVVRGLHIGSPKGFRAPHTIHVDEIQLVIDVRTLPDAVIHIKQILISRPDIIYEKGELLTNVDAIQRSIAMYLGPDNHAPRSTKKLIVDELIIRNPKAQASAYFLQGKTLPINLPSITLRNLGKAQGGLTPGELAQEVTRALKSRLTRFSFDKLLQSGANPLEQAGSALKGLFGQ